MPGFHVGVLRVFLTHAQVGYAAVSQDHDELCLVRPPLLLAGCKQILADTQQSSFWRLFFVFDSFKCLNGLLNCQIFFQIELMFMLM